jgi:hypothetical protein
MILALSANLDEARFAAYKQMTFLLKVDAGSAQQGGKNLSRCRVLGAPEPALSWSKGLDSETWENWWLHIAGCSSSRFSDLGKLDTPSCIPRSLRENRTVKRSGTADLPLHGGRVPVWLAERMTLLGTAITECVLHSYGPSEFRLEP